MKIKFYKPTTSSRRFTSKNDFSTISRSISEKKLTTGKKRISGRDNRGRITVRFRGGGHKRCFRIIDFKRAETNSLAKVFSIEYDPNRSARISLLHYANGEKKYILTPKSMSINNVIESGESAKIIAGNSLPMYKIPLGTIIHNIEIRPHKGGQLARSAGVGAQLLSKGKNYAHVKLPSGEIRKIFMQCYATIGQLANEFHDLIHYGKAGRKRWLGVKPHNRGVSMNPVDHPHGGGEGKSSGGRHPASPWGFLAKGLKTRKIKRTNNMIIYNDKTLK